MYVVPDTNLLAFAQGARALLDEVLMYLPESIIAEKLAAIDALVPAELALCPPAIGEEPIS